MTNLACSNEPRQSPQPAPICTRCGGPISRYAFTVPTMDGHRHEICPVPAPIGEGARSLEDREPSTEAATLRCSLLNVLSFAASAGGAISAAEALTAIARIARQALAVEVSGARAVETPESIVPAVQRVRWLAARPSNALCDHPACHSSANPCDEYAAAARAKGGR